jgi:hypothetical protein
MGKEKWRKKYRRGAKGAIKSRNSKKKKKKKGLDSR